MKEVSALLTMVILKPQNDNEGYGIHVLGIPGYNGCVDEYDLEHITQTAINGVHCHTDLEPLTLDEAMNIEELTPEQVEFFLNELEFLDDPNISYELHNITAILVVDQEVN